MKYEQAIKRLKSIRERTRSKLDREALDFAIDEMEGWLADDSIDHVNLKG